MPGFGLQRTYHESYWWFPEPNLGIESNGFMYLRAWAAKSLSKEPFKACASGNIRVSGTCGSPPVSKQGGLQWVWDAGSVIMKSVKFVCIPLLNQIANA